MFTVYQNCFECVAELGLKTTYYGREAGGKVLAVYNTEGEMNDSEGFFTCNDYYKFIWLDDWYIYGSEADGRIATVDPFEVKSSVGTRIDGSEFPIALSEISALQLDEEIPTAMRDTSVGVASAKYQVQQRRPGYRNYEIKDHLGNVRTVIADYKNPFTTSGPVSNWTYLANVKNISNTYPYGKSYGTNAIYNAENDYRYGFNGMEKEKNISSSGNTYDFGARVYDSEFPTFLSRDPLQKNYPNLSPYVFGAANPISAIDPDGRIVIFINGLFLDDAWNGDNYWGDFDTEIMKFWKDKKSKYYDGSIGGKSALVPSIDISFNLSIMKGIENWAYGNNSNQNVIDFKLKSSLSATQRFEAGYEQAKKDAANIYNNLDENETIKIVTHSMGYAWGSGYQQGLIDYAVIELENPQLVDKISIVLNFAPFQAGSYATREELLDRTHHKISYSDPLMYPSWSPKNSNDITSFIERLFSSHPISRYTLEHVPKIKSNIKSSETNSGTKHSIKEGKTK